MIYHVNHHIQIESVVVNKSMRRKGYGRVVMNRCEQYLTRYVDDDGDDDDRHVVVMVYMMYIYRHQINRSSMHRLVIWSVTRRCSAVL